MLESNKKHCNNPSATGFIRQHCLDTPQGIMDYINQSPANIGCQKYHFPMDIAVHLADDKDCGGFGYLTEMGENHLHVPEFTATQANMADQELQIREERERKFQEKVRQLQEQSQRKDAEGLSWRNAAITEYMDELMRKVQNIRLAVQKRLRGYYWDSSIEVHSFGSFASGFCDMSSDADMTVFNVPRQSPNCLPIVDLANNLRRLRY
ncbi:hypothetical protein BGX24_008622 [Mortierella sp. AD032]|nr:hypothetical protein BGX24_008622 [Mortierella sp. AD032]